MTKGQKITVCITTIVANIFFGLLCAIIILMLSVNIDRDTGKPDTVLTLLGIIPFILGLFANFYIYGIFRKRINLDKKYIKLVIANICGMLLLPFLAMLEVIGFIDFLQNF
jgi:biotin transporter BioY